MSILAIVQLAIAILTILTGLVSLLVPGKVLGFTGLRYDGARGKSEIRAVLGGGFIGLGLAPILLPPAAYQMLGIAYLAIGAARLVSMLVDKATERSNLISLAVEIVFGVVLLF
jgi:hypothetical protein